jgi:Fic family protein
MKSFVPKYLDQLSIPIDLSILLESCARSQGKEELWEKTKPEVLYALREQSIISSTESSNRIEGVEVDAARLSPLVKGKVKPRDRSEEEVVGYKNALNWIHSKADKIELSSQTIQKLHFLSQEGSISDAGQWKSKNNEIIEISNEGKVTTRFVPSKPEEVALLINNLCLSYKNVDQNKKLPKLLLIATVVFDFLCIHPFRDGNGRTSRLLTLLLLYKLGFNLGRYISIERIIEETKESYYEALQKSSVGWHNSEHDIYFFWQYFVRTIAVAYDRLDNKFAVEGSFYGGKTQLIRNVVMRQIANFKLGDIVNAEPGISEILVQKVLANMRKEGLIKLHGRGRGAYWSKVQK